MSTGGGAPGEVLGAPDGRNSPCTSKAQRITLWYAPPVRPSEVQSNASVAMSRVHQASAVAGLVIGVRSPTARRIRYVTVLEASRRRARSCESPPIER